MAVALASALGLTADQNAEALALAELERGPAVLVLDNLENAWENDRESVEDFLLRLASLSSSHGLALVVTLRGAERPAGISWYTTPPVSRLERSASQTLFLAIAGTHLQNDAHLDDVLSAADDLPLAVELLAHQAEEQPDLADLWQRWQEERTLILRRGAGRTRDTNLEISIDLSLKSPRLTDSARRMLGVLAQLPAGMQRSDLRAVFGTKGADGLNDLHKIGIANADGERWRLLNPVREHVREHHAGLLTFDARRALVQYFQELAKSQGADFFGINGVQARQRLTQEFPNLQEESKIAPRILVS